MSVECGDNGSDANESHRIIEKGDCSERTEVEEDKSAADSQQEPRQPFKSMFGEVSVIRDFLLAAVSDGYYSVCNL